MKIRILVFEGADELDFVGPLEIFRRAAKLSGGIDVRLVTLEPCAQITAAYGLRVVPDGVFDGIADLVVIPGGGWASRSPCGIRAEIERGLLTQHLAALRSSGTVIAGVCTGTMALATAGLLDERPAVTHRSALQDLRSTTAEVLDARVVDDGDVITCGGVTSSLDLALHLVERFCGLAIAEQIASSMEYSRNTDVRVSATGQNAPA
jgi:transcriptional regulator GlxA family with amidase domain